MSVEFISNEYLIMKADRALFFGDEPRDPAIPESFGFAGILKDGEKERQWQREQREQLEANRAPSPRETWFERTHPMGLWSQGGW